MREQDLRAEILEEKASFKMQETKVPSTEEIREQIKTMRRIELREKPFEITGLPWVYERGIYDRIPRDIMPDYATDLFKEIATETSGGFARIRTNSSRVYFYGKTPRIKKTLYHMSVVGRSGFDFHITRPGEQKHFLGPSVPFEYEATDVLCEVAVKRSGLYDERPMLPGKPAAYDLTIVLPIYNAVDEACIYVDADAEVLPPLPQKYDKQVLFYGSSITQGACASRPSNCYTNRLALALDCPIINFGFSGHAMAEPEIADLILTQKMDIFVMDYDHNAPRIDYLSKTHKPFFDRIRAARPELPIILMTKPDFGTTLDDNEKRREVILDTFRQAKAAGDENIYFVDGKYFFKDIRNEATVDVCHPNDLGFQKMYEAVYPLLKALLDGDPAAAKWKEIPCK